MLSSKPTVKWVLLGSGVSKRGQNFGSLYMQVVCAYAPASDRLNVQ